MIRCVCFFKTGELSAGASHPSNHERPHLFTITGSHPADSNRIALMLTAEEKQRLLADIKKSCRGQCTFAAGVKYTYASVGLILEKLEEPFALDGVPFEKK